MLWKICILGTVVLLSIASCPVESRTTQTDIVKGVIRNAFTVKDVKCGNTTSTCNDNYTCCMITPTVFGCCDLKEAVCCEDHKSCCPHGYKCDIEHKKCIPTLSGDAVSLKLLSTANGKKENVKNVQKDVVCPDKISYCPENTTCCSVGKGQYGCCPYQEAVCCKDGVHCCPKGYTCDLVDQSCTKSDHKLKLEKIVMNIPEISIKNLRNLGSITCPDRRSQCPDGTTCCKLATGTYGCCPIEHAVCCEDGLHCCPNGYRCDTGAGTCVKSGSEIRMLTTIVSQQILTTAKMDVHDTVDSSTCSDGSQCPGIETCCKLKSGAWGCCLYPNATCCVDGVHCCPSTYNCVSGKCVKKGEIIVEALEKVPAVRVSNVICPDGQSECLDGSTCCKLGSGQYGCCPIPKAVCCADGKHCCPQGYACHVSAGTCVKGLETIKALLKIPASVPNVICPDGESQCPDGSTCCKLSSGQYGCCPVPRAVCCDDGMHCCPEGYTCHVSAGTCTKGLETIKALLKIPASVSNVICPDGRSECPDGNTCCKLSSGQYGCCPVPRAVCCKDGMNCCPEGYTCDSAGRCTKGLENIKALLEIPASVPNVICPDGDSECPDGSTCCKLSSGQYGCCPIPKAVCCNDGMHCCPEGYTCHVSAGTCTKGPEIIKALLKIPASVPNVICPDGESECPDGSTCCKLSSGQYGCCPIPKAVCCDDGMHCCPEGYTCHVSAGTCTKGPETIKALLKIPASVSNVICPDGRSECPDGSTCCKLSSGQYGCCPVPRAVCCKDGMNCCPEGYTCDSAGRCTKGLENIKALLKIPASVPNVICPDGDSECPDGSTCCKLSSGQYGCCPISKAVCCNDGMHCCPEGYTCHVSAGTCTKGPETIKALLKIPASVSNVICPDGQSVCPDGSTCCKLSSGQYGCCPVPKAVCCKDGMHCCPEGYNCDVSAGTCTKGPETIKALLKIPALNVNEKTCPDGKSRCPDGTTCCKLQSGEYGCCPLAKAVCCSDGVHCCPNGYTCDSSSGTCSKGSEVIKALTKIAAKGINDVVCPDGHSSCPDGSTCCKLFSGQWGCCPLPKAVCCNDGEHCCPASYSCDTTGGTCTKGTETIQSALKISAMGANSVTCPDGQSQCPDGTTCCKLSSARWGCCPLPNAVCCNDGEHCCPGGYTCDTTGGTCTKGIETIKSLLKTSVIGLNSVICPGGQAQCPDGTTCCKLSSGQWGCCPIPKAVCCNDGEHCCPEGYTCDTTGGTCIKGTETIKSLMKTSAIELNSVICPGGQSQCPDGTTCCKLSSGQWGCCPILHAVCCNDGEHCCPEGYTCDTTGGTCIKGTETIRSLLKTSAIGLNSVICPGGQAQCPDGTTCCKLSSGQWGCCPMPRAVCCNDGEHCCPEGYTCDTTGGTCIKGTEIIKSLLKISAIEVNSVICPGGQSQCPDGTTCCKLSSGQWGCCPILHAVCCNDGEHCCPEGYTCDTTGGRCTKGNAIVEALTKITANGLRDSEHWCPDGTSKCPNGTTCCHVETGDWGCCPFENAVCCGDKIHCCPKYYTCNMTENLCNKKNSKSVGMGVKLVNQKKQITPLSTLKPATRNSFLDILIKHGVWEKHKGNCVMCPDDSECPNFSTCCQLPDGKYGCCGHPSAVCCSDHLHCCPHGFVCDLKSSKCIGRQDIGSEPLTKMTIDDRSYNNEISAGLDEM
uniref:multiple epidermal growth factor-like domains protein 6 isoform X6 n=1 Tax=Styela clava TaxID=7725 RepID=UPI00193A925F|nr:multiple epidermal growth factor-like domains protein 6 isoform X6 [Styela clava]